MLFTPARRVLAASLVAGQAAGWALLALQADSMAGSFAAVPIVLRATTFGHVLAAQLVALALAGAVGRRGGGRPALLLCGLAAGLQCLHLHGFAMEGRLGPLTASDLLHLLAGAAWLGGLLPLARALRAAPPAQGAAMLRRFSRLAAVCLLVLAATASYQGWVMVGSVRALIGTDYGWTALGKTVLFATLLAFAMRHRFFLAPRLRTGPDPAATRRLLVRSITAEAAVGLLLVLLAALLASLPPGMDMGDGPPS